MAGHAHGARGVREKLVAGLRRTRESTSSGERRATPSAPTAPVDSPTSSTCLSAAFASARKRSTSCRIASNTVRSSGSMPSDQMSNELAKRGHCARDPARPVPSMPGRKRSSGRVGAALPSGWKNRTVVEGSSIATRRGDDRALLDGRGGVGPSMSPACRSRRQSISDEESWKQQEDLARIKKAEGGEPGRSSRRCACVVHCVLG